MIFKVRPLLTEIVKLGDTFSGVPTIDNENGRPYKVTWWNDGHVERESLGKPVGTSAKCPNSEKCYATEEKPYFEKERG